MIVAKILSVIWMLGIFWLCALSLIRLINDERIGIFDGLMAILFAWLLLGYTPVAIAKFAWGFIR